MFRSTPLLYLHTELVPLMYFSLKDNIVYSQMIQISCERPKNNIKYNPMLEFYTNMTAAIGRCWTGSTAMDGSD